MQNPSPEELLDHMKSSRFITGIFNYCDYWCERCAFTRQCRNFAMSKEEEHEAAGVFDTTEATRKAFWDRLAFKLREASIVGGTGEQSRSTHLLWHARCSCKPRGAEQDDLAHEQLKNVYDFAYGHPYIHQHQP